MPTPTKNSANMTKHMSQAEREMRQQAEAETLPKREKLKLKKPGFIKDDQRANAYWNQIIKRMEGLALLDDLDSEMLAGYCSMLSRRDQTTVLISKLMKLLGVADAVAGDSKKAKSDAAMTDQEWESSAWSPSMELSADELIEAVSKLDTLQGKLQALERNLLQYAEKLGLTPSGRVRLAQKRARDDVEVPTDPDADLFGD